MFESNMNSKI